MLQKQRLKILGENLHQLTRYNEIIVALKFKLNSNSLLTQLRFVKHAVDGSLWLFTNVYHWRFH